MFVVSGQLRNFCLHYKLSRARIHNENLKQRSPTWGSRTPGGPKQHFQGSEMQFESASLYVLGCALSKGTEI